MAITHPTAVRNTLADQINTLVNAGAAAGKLVIKTSGDAVLVTLIMSDPAFGASASGTITANAIATVNATAAGTAAKFTVTDSNDVLVYSGTVTATGGGGDLIITNTTIAIGDPISVTSLTYSASA